jgi:hypothetical protein
MESTDVAERKWACVAVSNLIQNDPSTRRLLQGKNVVGALITRLTDSEEEVVVEAVGALRYDSLGRFSTIFFRMIGLAGRNLCIDGGYDICAEMYNKNILVPLETFIPKVSPIYILFQTRNLFIYLFIFEDISYPFPIPLGTQKTSRKRSKDDL